MTPTTLATPTPATGLSGSSPLGPAPSARLRRARGPALVVALVLLAGVAIALLTVPQARGALRPDVPGPEGSLALASLLRDQGVRVDLVTDLPAAEAGPGRTVLVAAPERLSTAQRQALVGSGAEIVLVRPDAPTLRALAPDVEADPAALPEPTEPVCPLRVAVAAGPVDLEDQAYATPPGTIGCYPVAGGSASSLVAVAGPGRAVTVVGDGTPFTNDALADRGNAALTLQLLGQHPRLLWYLPTPDPAAPGQQRALGELLPGGVVWSTVQLLVAGVLVALWRGRRLGPLVREALPVAVPWGETVRGRARLYRRTGARGRAAGLLRERARRDLAARLGLDAGALPAEVADVVARRTGRRADEVLALLAGDEPPDDRALVGLAAELDRAVEAVARS